MKFKQSKLPLALMLALIAGQAQALGLGQIEVKSGLNQPLLAEIPILSATPEELESLTVRLASPEAFERVGLERPVGLSANLEMTVSRNARGQPVVLVTTSRKFNEPFLTFLLEVSWGKGTVVREFSALVDPPYIAPAIIRPMEAPVVAATPAPVAEPMPAPAPSSPESPPPVETTGLAEPEPAQLIVSEPEPLPPTAPAVVTEPAPPPPPMPVAPEPTAPPPPPPPPPQPVAAEPPPPPQPLPLRPQPAPPVAPSNPESFGPVSAGQTLWTVANQVRPDPSVTVNQMMMALLRANPDAFINGNINSLKRGSVLRIPAAADATSVSAEQAIALVREQSQAWQNRRAPAPQPIAIETETPKPTAVAKPAAPKPASPKPVAPKPSNDARLAIVPPVAESKGAKGAQSGASAGGGGTELRAELSQTKEELAARQAEVRELKSRVGDLEQQQSSRQRLIDMQNSQLKAMQDRLAQLEAEAAAKEEADKQTAAAPVEASAAVTEPAAATPATEPPTAETPAAETPSVQPPSAEPAPAAAVAAESSASGESWYRNPLVLGGAGVVVLLAGWLGLRGRRKLAPAPAPNRRISEDEALAASFANVKPAANSADAADERDDRSAAAETPAASMEDEIEPMEQAVEVESEQMSEPEPKFEAESARPAFDEGVAEIRDFSAMDDFPAEPKNVAADETTRLTELVVANPKDLNAHLTLLRHLHARGDAMGFEVAAAKMHGHIPSPMDAHWREAVVMGASLAPRNPLFNAAGWNAPRFDTAAPPAEAPVFEHPRSDDGDWQNAATIKRPVVPPIADPVSMMPVQPAPGPSDPAEEDWDRLTASLGAEVEAIDKSIDLSGFDEIANASPDPHRIEAEVLAEDEASSTKIELAKAYLEIGDADGARSMLEEVVAEGGPAAKAEAERLLKEIG